MPNSGLLSFMLDLWELMPSKRTTVYLSLANSTITVHLYSLPKELSLEAARTKKVAPNAIAFYSRVSPLSNFYSCSLVLNNTTYSSSEQAFQAQRALSIGRDDIVKKIMQEDDCYAIKKIGDSLKIPPGSDWYTSRDSTMKNILLAKFRQNDVLPQQTFKLSVLIYAVR